MNADFHARIGSFSIQATLAWNQGVAALFGPSGSGKTTIIRVLAGLLRPTSGQADVDGVSLFAVPGTWVPAHQRKLGVVFQENRLFPHLNVADNIAFGAPGRTVDAETDRLLDLLHLRPLLNRSVTTLSGGEAKRVALARALASKPKLLLLDEPLAGLDRKLRDAFTAYLFRIKSHLCIPVLLVTHDPTEILAVADHLFLISEGVVNHLGRPADNIPLLLSENQGVESFHSGKVISAGPHGSARLDCGNYQMEAEIPGAAIGNSAAVFVRAEDVVLFPTHPPVSTARNVLKGKIQAIHPAGSGLIVTIDIGNVLYSSITISALNDLKFEVGHHVFAMIKARAVYGIGFPTGSDHA